MKTRKLLALIMTIALALSLFACGASEAGKDTPPFSKVSLDCSEDDVVKAYGECSNISTNDQGGNVYTYLSDYKGKDGAVYISFGLDGKPISIQWISLPKTNDEYTELCNTLTSDLNKQYGDAYFTNETAEATVWKDDSKAVTLFTINSNDSYTVSVNYAAKSAEEIAEAFKTDDANAAAELEAKSKVYRKGETAETANYKLTVDTVDATPEFEAYTPSDSSQEYFFVSFELENTSDEALATRSFLSIVVDGERASTRSTYEKYNGVDEFDEYSDLQAGRKTVAYISATIPVDWKEVQLITSDGVTFAFDHNDLDAMSRKNGSNESTIYYIGDTMYRNGLAITLSSAKLTDYVSYSAYSYFEPDPGKHFLILFFDITNTLNQPQKIKWLYNYDTFIDDYADSLTYFIGTEIDGVDSLYAQDGTAIPSGKSMSGYMVGKVPDGWNKVELQSRQGTFEINSSDFQ